MREVAYSETKRGLCFAERIPYEDGCYQVQVCIKEEDLPDLMDALEERFGDKFRECF